MEDKRFNYMLLDRCIQDCRYWLGFGDRNNKCLWAQSPEKQIEKMKELYNSLDIKPEWTSLEEIEDLERQMLSSAEPDAEYNQFRKEAEPIIL